MLSKLTLPHLEINNAPMNTGPPSPTLSTTSLISSVSWMAEKTSSELMPILKHVYKSLKEKEKDLVLAAEIGKSLLEQNVQLKNSYDKLVKSSTAAIDTSSFQQAGSDDGDDNGADSGIDSADDDEADIRFVPSRGTREAMIEVLERKNNDLTQKLEQAMEEQDKNRRTHVKDAKKLEDEISYLKSSLEIATNKIQELHEMNERQKKIEPPPKDDNDSVVEKLYEQIDSIEAEKGQLKQSKTELESKLSATLKDLQKLKKQFEQFEFTEQDFKHLSEAYERQFSHIDELNSSLKDHQNVLQKLKEKGVNIYSVRSTPSPSVIGTQDDEYQLRNTLMEELETQWLKTSESKPTTPTKSISQSFQSLKEITEFTERSLTAFYHAPSVGLESVLSKATGIEQNLLDDALQFLDQIEKEHLQDKQLVLYNSFDLEQEESEESDKQLQQHKFLELELEQINNFTFNAIDDDDYPSTDIYPTLSENNMQIQKRIDLPNSFIGRLKNHFRQLFKFVWKWCRFAIVLTTALCISAWQGPDALFIKN